MVKIITDSGYCYGVKNAIGLVRNAAISDEDLYLAHPLLHNSEENEKLMEELDIRPVSEIEPPYEGKTVIYSAHGHSPDEEKYPGTSKIDGICPLIEERYRKIRDLESSGYPIIYVGKSRHQETKGFLGTFKNAYFVDQDDVKDISIPYKEGEEIVLVTQTTLSEAKAFIAHKALSEKYRIVEFFSVCPIYKKRFQQAVQQIGAYDDRENLAVIVAGDKTSSNANEIYRYLVSAFEDVDIRLALVLTDEEISELKRRDVFIVSSTSASDGQIARLIRSLES